MTAQTSDSLSNTKRSFWGQHGQKLVAAVFWLLLVGGYTWYYRANNLTTETALLQLVDLFSSAWGPLIYIGLYALRPLIFFPATLLTLTSGSIFGAGSLFNLVLAVLYTAIGANTSAMIAYLVGRFFGQGLLQEQKGGAGTAGLIQGYAERMRNNSFETVLIMRFIFLPYDLVNYLAGILRIDWKAFLLATILGSIPGTIAFVAFGASIDIKELAAGKTPQFNPWVLGFGLAILLVSLAISRYFKKRESPSAM